MLPTLQKEFRPMSFVRNASEEIVQQLVFNLTGEGLDLEDYQNDFNERYESFPDDLKKNFGLINSIACERAMPLLVKYAKESDIQYQELSVIELAIALFTKNKELFFEIVQWHNIDSLDSFRDFKGNNPVEPNHKNLDAFKNELTEFFKNQSRGSNINIDIYSQQNKIAYIIDYGDFLKEVNVFDDNERFKSIKQRQAKSITVLYYPNLAKFRIKCADLEIMNKVKRAFAKHLIGDNDFFGDPKENSFFDLNKLVSMQQDEFLTNPADGIKEVKITNIEVYPTSDKKGRIVVKHPEKVWQIAADRNLNLEQLEVLKVNIRFKFFKGKSNRRTIYFKKPNISNLGDSPRDELIKSYLEKWEILND